MRSLLAALVLVSIAPLAQAAHTPSCASVTSSPAGVHVTPAGLGAVRVWFDTNGVSGIQQNACTDTDGSHHDADEFVFFDANCPLGPGLCVI